LATQAADGSPCEGRVLQLFHRQGAPAALQCAHPGQPDDQIIVIFNPRQLSARWLVHEGGRLVRSLEGLAEEGVPDRFARHPLCPAARDASASRPDRLPGQLVVLTKVPADPYCFEMRVATFEGRQPALHTVGGRAEPSLTSAERQPWAPLLKAASVVYEREASTR